MYSKIEKSLLDWSRSNNSPKIQGRGLATILDYQEKAEEIARKKGNRFIWKSWAEESTRHLTKRVWMS